MTTPRNDREGCIVVTLPLPPKELNPNSSKRSSWFAIKRARAGKAARQSAFFRAKEAWQTTIGENAPPWKRVTIRATFCLPNRRGAQADQDNRIASLKQIVDGIAEAGVIENDRGVTWLEVIHRVDPAMPRLELEIREQPGATA